MNTALKYHLIDAETGERFDPDQPRWCGVNHALLDLDFSPHLQVAKLSGRKANMWRYRECLPIDSDDHIISFEEGFTPLLPLVLDKRSVLVKQEHLFPTGSFKDRGASVLISKAIELGIRRVVQDSSGNAGCAIAAYCARAGIACDIFVPEKTSPAKIAQIRAYGANVRLVAGDRQATAEAALTAAKDDYYASHCWNPFFLQGVKTFAYEIWEQLQHRAPDILVLPAGNGTLVLGAFIGFSELRDQGYIEQVPQIIVVQSAQCAPLFQAFQNQQEEPVLITAKETLAEGIAIATPIRGYQILSAVRDTKGGIIAVSEEEIMRTRRDMALKGYYIEPTAAVAIAGVYQIIPEIESGKTIVTAFTGHGLKSKN